MDKKELRITLIKTGLVLGAIFFFIAFALSAPEDSGIWGNISAVFSGFFETAKLLVGLSLAFAVLFFFFFFLFKGYKAFFSKEDSVGNKLIEKLPFLDKAGIFNNIKARRDADKRIVSMEENQKKLAEQISAMGHQIHRCELKADKAAPGEILSKMEDDMSSLTAKVAELQEAVETVSSEVLGKVENNMSSLTTKVAELQKTVETVPGEVLGKMEDNMSSLAVKVEELQKTDKTDPAEILGKMEDNMSSLTVKVAELQKTVETVPGKVFGKMEDDMSSLTAKVAELQKTNKADSGELLGKMEDDMSSLTTKVEAFRKTVEIVQDELRVMQGNMENKAMAETLPEKSDGEDLEEGEHRIFTFIEEDKNRDAFIKHVKEAVNQGLSYTKSIDYIVENSNKTLAEVIAAHPSLTRDYIKTCR